MAKKIKIKNGNSFLNIVVFMMILLVVAYIILTVESVEAADRRVSIESSSTEQSSEIYPVTLPTYTLVGIEEKCDGSVDGRRMVLASLWDRIGESTTLSDQPAIFNKKIFVLFYKHDLATDGAYTIFMGYSVVDWLRNHVTLKDDNSAVIVDLPTAEYWGYDVKGTTSRSVIKGWGYMYENYPKDSSQTALEIYNLDEGTLYPQNVTLYLKKRE